jgi:hypothetical protein
MSYLLNRSFYLRMVAVLATAAVCGLMGWSLVQQSKLALVPVALGAGMALLLVFADVGWTVLWVWPALSVLGYPLAGHLPGGKYVTFDRIWIGGMIALLLAEPKLRAHARSSRRMLLALALLVVVLGARALVTPATSLYPVRVWVDSLVLPLILFMVVRRAAGLEEPFAERMAMAVMVAGAVLGLIGIAQHFLGFTLSAPARFDGDIGEVRIAGPYAAPETYGLALVMCLAATLYWLLTRPRLGLARLVGVTAVAVELIAIFYTYFRVGWISAFIVLVAAFGMRPGRWARTIVTVCVVGLIAVPLFLVFETLPAVKERVTDTQNIFVRLATYDEGWHIFESAPLFGVGSQDYTNAANALPEFFVDNQPDEPYPHSSLFEVMAEDGIVGTIPLLLAAVAVWGLVREFGRASRSEPDAILASVLAAAAISYLIYSLTLTMLPYDPSNQMFAILLGLAAGRLDRLAGLGGKHAAAGTADGPPETG